MGACFAGAVRIELTQKVLETSSPALEHAPLQKKMVVRVGFEPTECQIQSLVPCRLATGQYGGVDRT